MKHFTSELAEVLGVEVVAKPTRKLVMYRYHGQINWKGIPSELISHHGFDVVVEVSGQKFAVSPQADKSIIPWRA